RRGRPISCPVSTMVTAWAICRSLRPARSFGRLGALRAGSACVAPPAPAWAAPSAPAWAAPPAPACEAPPAPACVAPPALSTGALSCPAAATARGWSGVSVWFHMEGVARDTTTASANAIDLSTWETPLITGGRGPGAGPATGGPRLRDTRKAQRNGRKRRNKGVSGRGHINATGPTGRDGTGRSEPGQAGALLYVTLR